MPGNDGKRWIFNHDDYLDIEAFRDDMISYYEIDPSEMSDEEQWKYLAQFEEEDYENTKDNIQAVIGDARIIAHGTAGLWYGSPEGGFIASNLQDAIWQCAGNTSGDIGFYVDIEENELHMTFAHHDGCHDLTLHAITSDGEDYINDMEYELAEQDIERNVFNTPEYSTKIDML